MLMHVIDIGHDVLKANNRIAEKNKKLFEKNGIFAVNIMGAIGSGKTTLIEKAIENLNKKYSIAVFAGDVIADMDANRFIKLGVKTIPINTGRECHLDAKLIEKAIKEIELSNYDILLMENVGNLICPADYYLGEHMRIVVVSVTEGDDIILKHPVIFKTVDLAIVHKKDLAEAVFTNIEKMENDIKELNSKIPVLKTSIHDTKSMGHWFNILSSATDNLKKG